MAAQQTLTDYPTGGESNADRMAATPTDRQAPLDDAAHDAAALDVPDRVSDYERVRATHPGEVVAWSDGTDRVAVVRVLGGGDRFEVVGADSSKPNPGRHVATATDRESAVEHACEYMGDECTDPRV